MAAVTKASTASPDASTAQVAPQLSGFVAGEAIDACSPCYIKASDGKIYMSNGTSANAAAKVDGWALQAAAAGQGVSLYGPGTRIMQYATGLTTSALLYLGTTAGRLDTATTTGGTVAIAKATSATDIVLTANVP